MEEVVPFLGDWFWWVAAGALLFLELMAPGVFFIWLAGAAAAVGLLDLVFDLGWRFELVLFAAFSLAAVFAGRPLLKRRHALDSDRPNLNQRMYDYVGKSYVLDQPIVSGRGRLRIEDTVWDVLGPDAAAGAHVKVVGVDGLRLKVKPE